ncbi:HDOD domain-containing protein [Oxalobacteraceae bacterium]|nr:HDOD domain-containing protein [Oxalobacteraceae bacterium]
MSAASPAPPVFFQLLAERTGHPGALVLAPGREGLAAEQAQAMADALPIAGLQELSIQLPCFYRSSLLGPVGDALETACWHELHSTIVLQVNVGASLPGLLPPPMAWVDGDWYLAAPPKPVGAQAASRALATQLVQLVAADADTHEIEALLRRDPTLSYHLLRLVNSLGMGSSRRVTSFSQALMILGRQQLRRWLNLMLFSAREGDARSPMLLARVAVRAHAMELLAKAAGLDRHTQEQGFMAGMFSLLGVLFGMPLAEVLQPLAIGETVQDALLNRGGELGCLLALVDAAEQRDGAALLTQLDALQLGVDDYHRIMVEAHLWMLGLVAGGAGSAHA